MPVEGSIVFALWKSGFSLEATGIRQRLNPASASLVEQAVRGFFPARAAEGPALLLGALPFDIEAPPLLFQPDDVRWGEGPAAHGPGGQAQTFPPGGGVQRIIADPPARGYAAAVRQALLRLADPEVLRKVVLARSLVLRMPGAVDPLALAARLARDPSVATFLVDLEPGSAGPRRSLVGATPELLLSRRGRRVASHPLAGSAGRSADPVGDRQAGEALLASAKDRREHALVVEAILDQLAPLCSGLSTPEGATLRSTATMWHLGTRIEGELKGDDMPSAAGLAALLHPTPAVGGYPRQPALALIRELETHDRGFYAGAVGWTDAAGDGDWYVALRCAELAESRLVLHAGAGIVPGSDPAAEVAETSAKFRAMLEALGVDEGEELMEAVS